MQLLMDRKKIRVNTGPGAATAEIVRLGAGNKAALSASKLGLAQALFFGGWYWDRTSGPCRVKAVLYL